MSLIKKLTSKNKQDFVSAASHILDCCDVEAFKELVEKDDFLFDFIKSNVANRLSNAVNSSNYLNLLKFLPYYSNSYVDFIAENLAKFADEDLTDTLLEIFKNGSDSEKAYCAKYFSIINDSLALDMLRQYAFSEFEPLAFNCANALSVFNDRDCFNNAIESLKVGDDFSKLNAVRFLVAFGDKSALTEIFNSMRNSSLAEHLAIEIPYLITLFELFDIDKENAFYTLNLIVDGLGEISSLSQVFDFQLYEIFEELIKDLSPEVSFILLNAKNKFETLTENDEYLYDEDKNTKSEIFAIKELLLSLDENLLINSAKDVMFENSDFVFDAIDIIKDEEKLVELSKSSNPTLVLKALGALKSIGKFDKIDKNEILSRIENENIKAVISAL